MPNDLTNPAAATLCVSSLRPIGAVPEWALQELCLGCGDCEAICPENLIKLDDQRRPVLTQRRRCRRCGLCADVCMHGAIELTPQTKRGLAEIKEAMQQPE